MSHFFAIRPLALSSQIYCRHVSTRYFPQQSHCNLTIKWKKKNGSPENGTNSVIELCVTRTIQMYEFSIQISHSCIKPIPRHQNLSTIKVNGSLKWRKCVDRASKCAIEKRFLCQTASLVTIEHKQKWISYREYIVHLKNWDHLKCTHSSFAHT